MFIGAVGGQILQFFSRDSLQPQKKFSIIITSVTKPGVLIGGCEGHVEDIYQRDTGHNTLCLVGKISGRSFAFTAKSFTGLFVVLIKLEHPFCMPLA